MLSIGRCRELLGDDLRDRTDGEVAGLLDELYAVARAVAAQVPDPDVRRRVWSELPADERADIIERAAIMEYDGGLTRDAAERAAIAQFCRDGRRRSR